MAVEAAKEDAAMAAEGDTAAAVAKEDMPMAAARERIAVSACLLGEPCRYDGASKPCAAVQALTECHEVVPVCPEVAGGLPTPRVPSEIDAHASDLRVIAEDGADNTAAFVAGARATLDLVQARGCTLAVLKEKSPSCGSSLVYDGTFSGTLVSGEGVACRFLRDAGLRVVSEDQVALGLLHPSGGCAHRPSS